MKTTGQIGIGKNIKLTDTEKEQIISAAQTTWSAIAYDAQQIGATSFSDALELVSDAGRIVDHGRLDKQLYNRLPAGYLESFLKKNKNWY